MALPTLLSDSQISRFEFYWEGRLRCGMSIDGRLYALLSNFSHTERTLAYEKGCQLAQSADDVVLTASSGLQPRYRLWLRLASQNRHWLEDQNHNGCSSAEQAVEASDEIASTPVSVPSVGSKLTSRKSASSNVPQGSAMPCVAA